VVKFPPRRFNRSYRCDEGPVLLGRLNFAEQQKFHERLLCVEPILVPAGLRP